MTIFHSSDICSGALNLPTHQKKYIRFHGCLSCPVQVFMFQLFLQLFLVVPRVKKYYYYPIKDQCFRCQPMRGLLLLLPCVGSVCVTPNYNVTCARVLTHVISVTGNFMIPLSALFLFLCRTRD